VHRLIIPIGVLPVQAAVATDAVATAYHAIFRRGEIKQHERVFLFGLGGLGMNALQLLLYIGAEVIVSDTRQTCLDRALSLGVPASHIVPLGTAPQDFVLENFKNFDIDAVLDFVGKNQTFQDAQQIGRFTARRMFHPLTPDVVRRGGRLLCIGSLDNKNTIEMKLATRKRLSFMFSYGSQAQDLPKVLDLIATKRVEPQVQSRPLKDLQAVLAELEVGEVEARVVLIHS
jgi:propanol-preferring alcohol dehydrogenase